LIGLKERRRNLFKFDDESADLGAHQRVQEFVAHLEY
jgi:hypothetical protein